MAYKSKIIIGVMLSLHGEKYFIHIYVCTISKDIGLNKEKEICSPNKESISGHRCEGTNMAVRFEIFMNCSKDLIGICRKGKEKQIWLPRKKFKRDHRCERTNFTNVQYFRVLTKHFLVLYTCVHSVQSYWHNTENKIYLQSKHYISVH